MILRQGRTSLCCRRSLSLSCTPRLCTHRPDYYLYRRRGVMTEQKDGDGDEEDAANSADDGVAPGKRGALRGWQALDDSDAVTTRSRGEMRRGLFSRRRLRSRYGAADMTEIDNSAGEVGAEQSEQAEEHDSGAEGAAPAGRSGRRRSGRAWKAASAPQEQAHDATSSSYDPGSEAGDSGGGSTSTSEDDSEPPDAEELGGGGLVADEQVTAAATLR